MSKFTKYGTAPVSTSEFFFTSEEARNEFENADPNVKKCAMHLLEMCVKKSMHDIQQDYILKRFQELEERIKNLEDRDMKKEAGKGKVKKVMEEYKEGKLHSGSKKGPEVTNPKQAVAIALSEARRAGAKIPKKKGKK